MIKKIYRRLILLFKSLMLTIFFLYKALFSRSSLVSNRSKFVVSLTTYGSRFNYVFLTIESIFFQEVKPSAIYLWIYKDDKPSAITKWFLEKQIKRGLNIQYVEKNTRSYKKLSYILSETNCSFDFVITADDDVFYPKHWLRNFVDHKNVNTHVLCNRGRVITFEKDTAHVIPYKYWPLANVTNNLKNLILPTGVSGISYPIKSLDHRISAFETIDELCPYADDIWYKMVTTSNGYQSIILNNRLDHYPPLLTSLAKGLEKMNVNEDLNSIQFLSSMAYFGLDKNEFEREFN